MYNMCKGVYGSTYCEYPHTPMYTSFYIAKSLYSSTLHKDGLFITTCLVGTDVYHILYTLSVLAVTANWL